MADIRCPRHPVRLLLRVIRPSPEAGRNLIEVACRDCRNDERRRTVTAIRVLHRFTVDGQLVETEIVYADV